MKIGPDNGNSGAVIRWGNQLDNGIWIRGLKFRRLWIRWRFMHGMADFGLICFHWGNQP